MREINEFDDALMELREHLERWARWARPKDNKGWATKTIEHSAMMYGGSVPRGQGYRPVETHAYEEALEAVIVAMPEELRGFIVAEFVVRGTPQKRAKHTGTSVAKYYTRLDSALCYLLGVKAME
jgi:hypothetical protein|tara:strand:- start:2010 stop:2384 length:375 start_codon:yes stop_codon:yes gene_type:complete